MANVIIVVIIVLLVFAGIRSSIKHFKGEGGCCGGGSVSVKKKKLKSVMETKTVKVDGMTCDNCRKRVENSINEIDGVAAKVNLKKKEAVISMEKPVSDEQIKAAIEKAGYTVIAIQ